jgi:hypothetical protein
MPRPQSDRSSQHCTFHVSKLELAWKSTSFYLPLRKTNSESCHSLKLEPTDVRVVREAKVTKIKHKMGRPRLGRVESASKLRRYLGLGRRSKRQAIYK